MESWIEASIVNIRSGIVDYKIVLLDTAGKCFFDGQITDLTGERLRQIPQNTELTSSERKIGGPRTGSMKRIHGPGPYVHWTGSMDPVHGGGLGTRGPGFVLFHTIFYHKYGIGIRKLLCQKLYVKE